MPHREFLFFERAPPGILPKSWRAFKLNSHTYSQPLLDNYLKTLEAQETEMNDLQAKLKALQADEAKAKAAYDDFLANLSAE